ncbi:MAG TPA: ribosome maturation factor RimP [Burkholderiales bacterium]|jgi:ribosome maturation factor RimP|nr:ribosome maturation factor RimP [Burkholderiales bacterium]
MAAIDSKIEPAVSGLGFELVDVQASNGGRLLRVFIDKPAGSKSGITLDDCAAVSRQLTRVLPVEGVDFERLEVSSPGLDRPLRKAGDFARFAGQKAEVRMRTPDATGRRKFVGVLRGTEAGRVNLDCDGEVFALALDDVERAKLIPAL